MGDYVSSITADIKPKGYKADYRICYFGGAMDKAGLSEIRQKIEDFIEEIDDEKYVVFDFGNLEFINSESIGFLLMIHTRLVKRGKRLIVTGAQDHVRDVLDVVGILKIIDYYQSVEAFEKNL
jgi:anti-anti-sigma factor